MPIIPRYEQTTDINPGSGYRKPVSAPENAFGGNIGQAVINLGEQQFKQAYAQQQKEDADAVVGASNSMTMDIINAFNGENGFFSLKGDNAKGVSAKAQQFVTDTMDKYAGTLNERQAQVFRQHMKPNALNYLQTAATHERNEADNAAKLRYANGVDINNQGIALNYQNPANMNTFLTRNAQLVAVEAKRQGWSSEVAQNELIARNAVGVSNAFTAAMENENYDAADNILKSYKGSVDPVTYEKMHYSLNKVKEQNEDYKIADSIVKQVMRPDGTPDIAKAKELLDSQYGVNATKTVTSGSESISWEQTKNLVSGNESGGNYEAYNNDSGATGKYQFMPETWRGIMGDAPMTPDNQEKAFDAKYKHIYDKWGAAGVLVAVYAGDANAERYMTGKKLLGEGGEYSADAPQYSGGNEYPSVRQYVINALGNDGLQGEITKTVSAFDAKRYKAISQLVDAKINDIVRIKNEQDREYKKSLAQQIDSVGSVSEADAIIDNSNLDLPVKNQLKGAVRTKFNNLTSGTSEQKFFARYERTGLYKDQSTLEMLQDKYAAGDELTDAQWKRYSDAKHRFDQYQNFITGGEYGIQQAAQQNKARYDAIMEDIWNSKTPQERAQKANSYKSELNKLGQSLDIDVSNDIRYILSNGKE